MQPDRRRLALYAICLGSFLATLDISIVNVALPTIQADLHTDIVGIQWVVNAYGVCLSAFMLSAGPMADRHGQKRTWLCGVALFTAGSALCGWAPSLPVLLTGRAVQGIAGAFLISGAMPILTHAFPEPKERAQVIGIWSAFVALALILGPLLGGLLLHHLGWQSIFLINLPLGVVAVALGLYGVVERKHPEQAARDPLGLVFSVVALGALAFGLIEAGENGGAGFVTLTAMAVAVTGFVLFALVERRVERPLLPLALFQKREFIVANIASFALGFAYYSSLFFFSIFLQRIQHWGPLEAGWRMMPQFVATLCVSALFGRLNKVCSLGGLTAVGYGLVALGLLMMVTSTSQTPYWVVAIWFTLLGTGAGLAVPATSITVMNLATTELSGAASATMNALRQMGMTIGVALLGTLMSERAIYIFAMDAAAQGIGNAQQVAREAITRYAQPDASATLQGLFVQAMEGGFQLAMLLAGLTCLGALYLLLTSGSRSSPIDLPKPGHR